MAKLIPKIKPVPPPKQGGLFSTRAERDAAGKTTGVHPYGTQWLNEWLRDWKVEVWENMQEVARRWASSRENAKAECVVLRKKYPNAVLVIRETRCAVMEVLEP